MPKILLVEDDPMIRDMLSQHLKIAGYQVITAGDGAKAVQRARVDHPELILMDIGLPVLNGWQATYRIRSMPATTRIPIIAVTAFAMKEDRARCLSMGCDEYETKPIDLPRLLGKIEALLSKTALV